jgi:uncharacterized protein DUF3667
LECKNCGRIFEDNYCPNCGQTAHIHRYSIKHILHDFFHTFTHVDSGILFLMKELTLRPGIVAREYIEGKRKKYFSPMQYLLLGIAVVTFLSVNLNLGTGLIGNVAVSGEDVQKFKEQFLHFFYKSYNIFQFLTIPFTAFYSWIFFRKSGFNYSENLILDTFLIGQRHLLYLIFVPFLYYFPEYGTNLISIHITIWTVYFIYANIQFFKPKNKFWAVLKTLFIVWLFIMTQALVMIFIFLVFFFKK